METTELLDFDSIMHCPMCGNNQGFLRACSLEQFLPEEEEEQEYKRIVVCIECFGTFVIEYPKEFGGLIWQR